MSFIDTIHPGCRIALARLTMDELGVARAIAVNELVSPQQIGSMWLFAIRITGTGVAYRPQLKETVFRPTEHYLNDDFLARCNGLPVILDHPEPGKRNPSGFLNSKEYKDRVIGAIMLPYIEGDEVWGIARIHDARAAQVMIEAAEDGEDLSTSPAVALRPADGDTMELKLAGGGSVLFEGKPYIIDHLAICFNGVWDKEGDPSGVRVDHRSDSKMAETKDEKEAREKTEREDKARKDRRDKYPRRDGESEEDHDKRAEEAEKADAARRDTEPRQMLETLDAFRKDFKTTMDGFSKRLDEVEKWKGGGRSDGESPEEKEAREKKESEEREDKKRRDAAEEESKKEKERADALTAERNALLQRVAALEARTPMAPDSADYNTLAGFQARADRSYSLHGLSAPRPMEGETAIPFRVRLLKPLLKHSADFKDVDISSIKDEKFLDIVEKRVFEDAERAARNPVDIGAGELRKIQRTDEVGRHITEFHGDPRAWMDTFRIPFRYATSIHRPHDAPRVQ